MVYEASSTSVSAPANHKSGVMGCLSLWKDKTDDVSLRRQRQFDDTLDTEEYLSRCGGQTHSDICTEHYNEQRH